MKHKMYVLILLLLSIMQWAKAQIVSIPDANFKSTLVNTPCAKIGNGLVWEDVDTNNDGEIQNAEAIATTLLKVQSASINDLTGLETFVNLDSLDCGNNLGITSINLTNLLNLKYLRTEFTKISNLNVSPLVNLEKLVCGSNGYITSLDVSACTNLRYLHCGGSNNYITTLNLTGLTNIDTLICNGNKLSSLDLSLLNNLKHLNCSSNGLNFTTLDISNLVNLEYLACANNHISNLDLSNQVNLKYLNCSNNYSYNIDVSSLVNLKTLYCESNLYTSLDLTPLVNIEKIYCNTCTSLDSLDLSGLTTLKNLYCSNTSTLSSINLSNCTSLEVVYLSNNALTTLDFSSCPNLQTLQLGLNPLTTLLVKNGSDESLVNLSGCTGLQYVCADATQLAAMQSTLLQYNITGTTLNSFCTFGLPTGNYNTVSGSTTYDGDANGCSLADSAYAYLMIKVSDGVDSGYVCSNIMGNYGDVYLDSGTFVLTPQFQNPTYFSATPDTATFYFPNSNFNLLSQDFCIAPNGIFPDVEIVLTPIFPARPGFDATYQLVFINKGTTTASGDITLDFMGNKMSFVGASISPSSQTNNQLTWVYSNLAPFEMRAIDITMHFNAPPNNNIGDIVIFTANIALLNDVAINDNNSLLSQAIVGAYDPNDKTCLEGSLLSNARVGEYLHYLVRFQNTGNFPAQNVVVEDFIDINRLDLSSLQVIQTSHLAQIKIENNLLQFNFANIMLADSFSNEPASHGYILFKFKPIVNFPLDSAIHNTVAIFFDYNPPVITNTAITAFGGFTSISATPVDATCYGAADGSVNITHTGGQSPYNYYLSGGGGGFQSSPTFAGLTAGTYHSLIKDALGFTDWVTFTIGAPAQIVLISSFSASPGALGQFSFTNTSTNATSYLWNFGNGVTDTSTNPIYTYPANGSYNVMLIASNACGSDTSYQTILVDAVSITTLGIKGEVKLYPNPSGSELQIMFESAWEGKVVLYDIVGKQLFEEAFEADIPVEKYLSMEGLTAGTYLLRIETARGNYSRKVVKE